MRSDKGMTLIELIVVLAVIAVLSGAAALALSNTDRRWLSAAGQTLQQDIREAQRMAVIEGRRYRVRFDLESNCYFITYLESRQEVTVKTVYLENAVYIKRVNAKYIEYSAKGTVNGGCTITLENQKYSVDLTVNVGAGRISIKDIVKKSGIL